MLHNTSGFTMLEMLLVLTIVSLIMFVMINANVELVNSNKINSTIRAITGMYEEVQMQCIANREDGYIKINEQGVKSFVNNQMINEYKFDDFITVTSNFLNDTISLNERGNIKNAGTITVSINNLEKKIIFNIGEGRYYVK